MTLKTKAAAAWLALALTGGASVAQQAQDREDEVAAPPAREEGAASVAATESLDRYSDEIVVTATREERSLGELPLSVTVLGREEIETATATATDNLLRTVPGVDMPLGNGSTNHPLASFVSMRGLGGARALVLLDGEPLNDSFFGFVSFERAPLDSLQKVEIVRGGGSSLFGTYALGGVINLVTRPIEDDALRLRALAGSHGTSRLNLYGSRRIGDKVGLSFNAHRFETDGYTALEPAARGAIDAPSRSRGHSFQLNAEYAPSPTSRWFARLSSFDQDGNSGTKLSRSAQESRDLAAGATWELGGRGGLEARVFHHDRELRLDNTDIPFFSGRDFEFVSNVHRTPATDSGASLLWRRSFGPRFRSVVAGVDLRRIRGEDRSRNLDEEGTLYLTEVGGGRQASTGVFAEVSVAPTPRLELLASARYDRWDNSEGERRTAPGGASRFADQSAREVNPRVALRYAIGGGFALRASAYRAFRAPTLDELYRSSSLTGSQLVANPLLEPEILEGTEAGFDAARGALRGQVNLFRNDVRNQITYIVTSFVPVFRLEAQNVGETRSQGIEALLTVALANGWTADGSYTRTATEILGNPANPAVVGKRSVGVPEDRASLAARYVNPSRGWSLSARGRYVGSSFVDLRNTTELDSHRVFDLYGSLPLGYRMELFAIAENVLDEEYPISLFGGRTLGAPRQLFAGIRFSL